MLVSFEFSTLSCNVDVKCDRFAIGAVQCYTRVPIGLLWVRGGVLLQRIVRPRLAEGNPDSAASTQVTALQPQGKLEQTTLHVGPRCPALLQLQKAVLQQLLRTAPAPHADVHTLPEQAAHKLLALVTDLRGKHTVRVGLAVWRRRARTQLHGTCLEAA
jgi:hypothetical protein